MFNRRAWPIRVRMVVLTSCIAALVCLAVSTLLLVGMHGRETEHRTEQLTDAVLRIVTLIRRDRLPAELSGYRVPVIQVVNQSGRPVSSTEQLIGKSPIATFHPSAKDIRAHKVICPPHELRGCMVVVAIKVFRPEGDWFIYASDRTVPWYVSPTLLGVCLGGSAVLVTLIAVGTSRTVRRTLVPVSAITSELAEITATDSGHRVPVPEARDEIKDLAETANATLDRLEGALKQLQRFTSDASHDLRSPITAIRARIEAALMDGDDADWPETGHHVLESLDRLQAIVTDLLTLARLDAGVPRDVDTIDLPGLVSAELQRSDRKKQVRADLEPRVTVVGDRLRLTRLLTNLLDNAERHARSTIKVIVRAEHDVAVLEVQDDGTGIAPEHREVVFQRFARLDAARHRDVNGTGLGLPIAREIARAHGGSLTIEESKIGARFVLRIPFPSDH